MKYIREKYNTYDLSEDYGIGFDENNNYFYFDKEDFDRIKIAYWSKYNSDYFKSSIGWLHRYIMNAKPEEYIDHINNLKYDCRKDNMRRCDNSENNRNRGLQKNNTSGCAGVNFDKRSSKWRVRVKLYGKEIHVGTFENFNDAVEARHNAEDKYYGSYSYDKSQEMSTYV